MKKRELRAARRLLLCVIVLCLFFGLALLPLGSHAGLLVSLAVFCLGVALACVEGELSRWRRSPSSRSASPRPEEMV
jgi:hypothetical protein